jgi:hypothetical protein
MLHHAKGDGAAVRGNSSDVTDAVHGGSGKPLGVKKASEPVYSDPTSCLVRDSIRQVRNGAGNHDLFSEPLL